MFPKALLAVNASRVSIWLLIHQARSGGIHDKRPSQGNSSLRVNINLLSSTKDRVLHAEILTSSQTKLGKHRADWGHFTVFTYLDKSKVGRIIMNRKDATATLSLSNERSRLCWGHAWSKFMEVILKSFYRSQDHTNFHFDYRLQVVYSKRSLLGTSLPNSRRVETDETCLNASVRVFWSDASWCWPRFVRGPRNTVISVA